MRELLGFLFVAMLAASVARVAVAAPPLPSFNVDKTQISVSGLSSGGFMAVQFHTAYSATIMGAGIVAGGPYNCAYVNGITGLDACQHGAPIGAASAWSAQQYAGFGQIDPVANLARSRVYLFSGTRDKTVVQAVVDAAQSYYLAVGVPAAAIQFVKTVPAGHAFISPSASHACAATASPYLDRCDVRGQPYDQAGALLTQIYGALNPPAAQPTGQLVGFDQTPFGGPGLGDTGFLYVPQACGQGASCKLHVAFHGCLQTPNDIGDAFTAGTGLNGWADANAILVLYPQIDPTYALNPDHCWDWFGYTGPFFNVQAGPQMAAVKAMIDRVAR
jgi:poly(3-hydroxybutyrate) depolymerase